MFENYFVMTLENFSIAYLFKYMEPVVELEHLTRLFPVTSQQQIIIRSNCFQSRQLNLTFIFFKIIIDTTENTIEWHLAASELWPF